MSRKLRIKNKKQGFTLLESIVAIGVLSLAIVGPMTFAARSINAAMTAKEQLTAFYLAEEGVEFVRNKRDGNFLQDKDWMDGLDSCLIINPGDNGCYIDVFAASPNDVNPCSGACPTMRYNQSANHYDYDAMSQQTPFRRTVKIEQIEGNPFELKIKVATSWFGKYGTKSFTLEEHIFNWH